VTVTLFETTHPGLFEGSSRSWRRGGDQSTAVQNGDTITATYFDASNNSNVTATATLTPCRRSFRRWRRLSDYYNAKVTG
jgi:hypothetical protein